MIVQNILWVLGNLVSEKDESILKMIFENTDLLNFLNGILKWPAPMPSTLMLILPWIFNSISEYNITEEQTSLCLGVLSMVVGQGSAYLQSQKKREKVVKESLSALANILERDSGTWRWFPQVISEFNLLSMCELALA